MGIILFIFGHFHTDLDAIFLAQTPLVRFAVFLRLDVDLLQIVKLLWICYGFVVLLVLELL